MGAGCYVMGISVNSIGSLKETGCAVGEVVKCGLLEIGLGHSHSHPGVSFSFSAQKGRVIAHDAVCH